MTLQARIDRAVGWRLDAQDARANILAFGPPPGWSSEDAHRYAHDFAIRRWLRAGYLLRSLLARKAAA